MAAERFQNEVLRMSYGPVKEQNLPDPPEPERVYFQLVRAHFGEWTHVW